MTHVSVSGTGVSPVRFSLVRNSKSQARRLCHGVASAVLFFSLSLLAAEPGWKAGTAKASITPEPGLWMAGFAARTNPAGGKIMELWIKALALEDADGHRAVILTSDLLGIPQNIYQHSCAALKEKFNLAPDQILLSASHTHCGPVLRNALYDIYPLDETQRDLIEKFSTKLEGQIVEIIGRAIADLSPVTVAAGQGTTAFAVNRRNNAEPDATKLINEGALKGPSDHAVPVLAVYDPDGNLKAILCGYACHNTALAVNEWCGDYSGYAQIALEKSHPGAQAMFFMGCGGDQNPLPRREFRLAERYGNMLASAVEEVLLAPPQTLPPKLVTKMEMVTLHLGVSPTEAELEKMQSDPAAPTRRWATRLLADLKAGKPFVREYPYPLQAWKFGDRQLLLTLGGEPVVDYALKFKRNFGAQTWVAGYCNDVMTYIPSLRVLREDVPPLANPRWGYEGCYAFTVYGLPARRWAEDVEDLISQAARQLVQEANTVKK
jgi:neutral ceramidase